ncbi:hypothetical protein E4U22_002897, partial [Claviceps purpurea]
MSNQAVGAVYQIIIDEVINTSRVDFEESGVEEHVLEELRQVSPLSIYRLFSLAFGDAGSNERTARALHEMPNPMRRLRQACNVIDLFRVADARIRCRKCCSSLDGIEQAEAEGSSRNAAGSGRRGGEMRGRQLSIWAFLSVAFPSPGHLSAPPGFSAPPTYAVTCRPIEIPGHGGFLGLI